MPIQGLKNTDHNENGTELFPYPTSKNALLIFTRNPELGKCKTRLAATVGDDAALRIYTFLTEHTVTISTGVQADKFVYYSEQIREQDSWEETHFRKRLQTGEDLGIRMENAFLEVFALGYTHAIIIGSDMYHLTSSDITNAFTNLQTHNFVMGPAEDGGYYLLGMKKMNSKIFRNKKWGTDTVQQQTLADLKDESVAILDERNDIDYYEDMKGVKALEQFLPPTFKV